MLLGTSDAELNALPLSEGWLTPADLLCVLDDIYTYDVLLEAEAGTYTEDSAWSIVAWGSWGSWGSWGVGMGVGVFAVLVARYRHHSAKRDAELLAAHQDGYDMEHIMT